MKILHFVLLTSRQSEVAAVGILADEEAVTLRWFVETYKSNNTQWHNTKVMMTDKDLKERNILRSVFPDACLLICLFHILR